MKKPRNSRSGKINPLRYGRGSETVGPIATRLVGLISLAVAVLLGMFLTFLLVALLRRHPPVMFDVGLVIALSALFTLFFTVVAVRLLVFGGQRQVNLFSPRIWVYMGAFILLSGGICAIVLLAYGRLKFAVAAAVCTGSLTFAFFTAAQITANRQSEVKESTSIRKTEITWRSIRDWVIRKKAVVLIALTITLIVWGAAIGIRHVLNSRLQVPTGFNRVNYINYPTYILEKQGSMLAVMRSSDAITELALCFFSYLLAFFIVDAIIQPNKRKSVHAHTNVKHPVSRASLFGKYSLISIAFYISLSGYIGYFYIRPTFEIVAFPRIYIFNPNQDVLYYNDRPTCRLSAIKEFYGYHKRTGRFQYSEWDIEMKNGDSYELDGGNFVRSDVEELSVYLNNYLKNYVKH